MKDGNELDWVILNLVMFYYPKTFEGRELFR